MSTGLAACGGSGDDGDNNTGGPTGSSDPNAVCTTERVDPSSELTYSTYFPTSSLDPATAPGGFVGGSELAAIYDTLTRYNPQTGEFDPFLAESLTSNADSTVWTLKLRPNVKFGNGDPLTADAVEFSINRLKTAKVAAAGWANFVKSMEKPDDLSVVMTLVRPWGGFPVALATEVGMVVNPKVAESAGAGLATNPTGAGVGAYEFAKFSPGEEAVLKAKTDYWGGPVCIGNLRVIALPGDQLSLDAFKKGEADVISLDEPVAIHDFKESGDVGSLSALIGGYGIGMNARPGQPTSDVRLRQAIAHAIDPNVVNQRAFGGYGIMSSGFTGKDMKIYSGVEGLGFDLEKAKSLVAAAKADGADTNLELMCSDATNQDMVLTVQALLNQAGFNVKTNILSSTESLARLLSGSFQITCGAILTRDDSPMRQLSQIYSTNPTNRYGFKDPAFDAAIDGVYLAKTVDEVKAANAKVQEQWNQSVPVATFYVQEQLIGFSGKVHGLYVGNDTKVGFEKAYIDK